MNARAAACAALLVACTAAAAGTPQPAPPPSEPAACSAPAGSGSHPLADRSGTLSRFEQLSPECLKTVVVQCAGVANRVLLDLGSAALCSIGYEALLRRGFGGDFHALVAWWVSVRDDLQAQ